MVVSLLFVPSILDVVDIVVGTRLGEVELRKEPSIVKVVELKFPAYLVRCDANDWTVSRVLAL
jgi:hypothetical protein